MNATTGKSRPPPGRILLLTPYTGGNLGDQAIQRSFIENLRARCAPLEFIGLTLRPDVTAAIHRIPCFPMSSSAGSLASGSWLQLPEDDAIPIAEAAVNRNSSAPATLRSSAKAFIKKLPGVVSTTRALRNTARLPLNFLRELQFVFRAWRLLNRDDLLVVAGGGQLDDIWGGAWAHPFALWQWTLLAKLKGCRIAFASVGWGRLGSWLSRYFVSRSLLRAEYRSYRDVASADFARALIGQAEAERWVPDNAFGLGTDMDEPSISSHGELVVGLSPIAFSRAGVWPTVETEVYGAYIKRLADFAERLTREGVTVVVFTTSGMDKTAVDDMMALLSETSHASLDRIEIARTATVEELLAVLRRCHIVIASRLHGVILAHLMTIPTLAISFDRKVDAHMADVGHTALCVDIRGLESASLWQKYLRTLDEAPALRQQLTGFIDACQGPLEEQYRVLLTLAGCERLTGERAYGCVSND